MNKTSISDILKMLFSDIKDARTLALRSVTALIILVGYIILTNQESLLDYAKNFSRSSVIRQISEERANNYPKVAKERATMLYTQSGSDGVFIAEYKPKFINNYQDVVAWEARSAINPGDMINLVINKSSPIYQVHVLGHAGGFTFKEIPEWQDKGFITSGVEYRKVGITYLYTCPIFDMDNSYSGYVGIGFTEPPYTNEGDRILLENYLEKICIPHARSLGRKK